MLSLETAQRLKAAGLKWEPQEGDFLYYHTYGEGSELGVISDSDMGEHREESLDNIYTGEWIFAPRLDQLLAEIEKRGWKHELYSHPEFGKYHCVIQKGGIRRLFDANSPEEAAAQALIWILAQKEE